MPETTRPSDGQTNHVIIAQRAGQHRKSFERINVIVTILYDAKNGQNIDQFWWNCTPDHLYLDPAGVTNPGHDDGPGVMFIINVYPLAGSRPLPGTSNGGNHRRLDASNVSVTINWPTDMTNKPQPVTGRFDGPYQETWFVEGQALHEALEELSNYTDSNTIGYSVSMTLGGQTISIDPEIELGLDEDA